MKSLFAKAGDVFESFFALVLLLILIILIILACLAWEVIKVFVWAFMFAGIPLRKIKLLYRLQRVHFRLFELEDGCSCLFSEGEGTLQSLLKEINQKCEELKIADWRQNLAYWLAVN
jgi:hypothetical protein